MEMENIKKQSRSAEKKPDPTQYLLPITHRRGWGKEREEVIERVGVRCVLLEESNKEPMWFCSSISYYF